MGKDFLNADRTELSVEGDGCGLFISWGGLSCSVVALSCSQQL